jgi:AraC family transcriptional regulator
MWRRRCSKMRICGCALLCLAVAVGALNPVVAAESEQPTKIHLKHTEPRSVAVAKHQGPYAGVPQAIADLSKAVAEGGYHQAGPVMVAYFNDPGQTPEAELLWEVRIPVAYPGPIGAAEGAQPAFKYFDPMFVAYTYHIGPYDDVGNTYLELMDWAQRNEYQIVGPPVEVYWSDPEKVPEERWVTEIWFPVLEKKIPGAVVK